METTNTGNAHASRPEAHVELAARPERRLIPREGDARHVDFVVRVTMDPSAPRSERLPLTLALVLDRSGSMSGEKLPTAKRAALAVLDRLEERDTAAVVVFDDMIDTVQAAAPATPQLKASVREALSAIHARGSTALHEGWLTGCQAITRDDVLTGERLARCFLLTDGLANVGVCDPELIATDARGIRERAGITTSTFGIGHDYAEDLLGPMAEGGSGQFHHLRAAEEIASTFVGELGEMLIVALTQVHLELALRPGVEPEVVSAFSAHPSTTDPLLWTVSLGDLLSGEDTHVVVRFGLPRWDLDHDMALRARLVWMARGVERTTDWHEVRFTYADAQACEAEQPDAEATQVIGEHLADRANREAIRLSRQGDVEGAGRYLRATSGQMRAYALSSPQLAAEALELEENERLIRERGMSPAQSKETYSRAQRRSSGKRDLRGKPPNQPREV
jgi:Ca-activated chloride channel homolog